MKTAIFATVISILLWDMEIARAMTWNRTCGKDLSKSSKIYQGVISMEHFPWMGILYYPGGRYRLTTGVVLVTKQMVIAAAMEIDRLSKRNFRAKCRVVLGQKCGQNEIRIRDYNYHPEFYKGTINTLAIVQLETDHVTQGNTDLGNDFHSFAVRTINVETKHGIFTDFKKGGGTMFDQLRPICAPFAHFNNPEFFTMTLSADCRNAKLRVFKMKFVDTKQCMNYYRRSGLDQSSVWPSHTACATTASRSHRKCLWRSGSALVIKQYGRWSLLGFGIYGPGCNAPSRFIDYGRYSKWVEISTTTVGYPAVTRLDSNFIVLRRSFSNVQRYGPCDVEETEKELYTDKIKVIYRAGLSKSRYNITIIDTVEYSCVVFKARALQKSDYAKLDISMTVEGGHLFEEKPYIRIRRWCSTPTRMCHGFQFLEIHFYVEIFFSESFELQVFAYGKKARAIDAELAIIYADHDEYLPNIPEYDEILEGLKTKAHPIVNRWFYGDSVLKMYEAREHWRIRNALGAGGIKL